MILAALAGASGRMGMAVQSLLPATPDISLCARIDPALGTSFAGCAARPDVVIDFSTPRALEEELAFCVRKGAALVLATTGHPPQARAMLEEAAAHIAVFHSANLSYGAYVLGRLAAQARRMLGDGYDAAIVERHHRGKRDAPSGTAQQLAQAMGMSGMPTLSVRVGGLVGVHEVGFYGPMDTLTLKHDALDRRLFARGALEAARWLVACAPGLYGMEDWLSTCDAR